MAYGYGEWGFRAYVPVAQKLARGRRAMDKLARKRGRPAEPVTAQGRNMAATFWGKAWCNNLACYSDFASRLPRGRAYARNGSVLDLHIAPGRVEAMVAGSELYEVAIDIARLPAVRWKKLIAQCAGHIGSLIELLRGELSTSVLAMLTDAERGLFPAPPEIAMDCSCPDWAGMCKHIAAALYCVGARLDQRPELFFTLRQVDQAELIAGAGMARPTTGGTRGAGSTRRLAAGDLSAVFGIQLDDETPAPASKRRTSRTPVAKPPSPTAKPSRPRTRAAKPADRAGASSRAPRRTKATPQRTRP